MVSAWVWEGCRRWVFGISSCYPPYRFRGGWVVDELLFFPLFFRALFFLPIFFDLFVNDPPFVSRLYPPPITLAHQPLNCNTLPSPSPSSSTAQHSTLTVSLSGISAFLTRSPRTCPCSSTYIARRTLDFFRLCSSPCGASSSCPPSYAPSISPYNSQRARSAWSTGQR